MSNGMKGEATMTTLDALLLVAYMWAAVASFTAFILWGKLRGLQKGIGPSEQAGKPVERGAERGR